MSASFTHLLSDGGVDAEWKVAIFLLIPPVPGLFTVSGENPLLGDSPCLANSRQLRSRV